MLLITRRGCCLCEQAEQVADAVCASRGVPVDVLDVDAFDPELRRAWTDHVPVTVVDGQVLSIWTLDARNLASALETPAARRDTA